MMMKQRQQKNLWNSTMMPKFTTNNPNFSMIREKVKEERRSLRSSINQLNKANIPYLSTNYLFITKVAGAEMRQRNDKDTAKQFTLEVNTKNPTKTKSTLHKTMIFKYTLALPSHSLFRILSRLNAPDSTLKGSNSTIRQGTSNCTYKRCLDTLSMSKNNNNAIAVGKAVNALMEVMHGIEGDANKVKIAPWKSKQPNLEVMRYIKVRKYPEVEVGQYVHAVREGKPR